jgi:eukaryotic-like serine/threonine-protein kinase
VTRGRKRAPGLSESDETLTRDPARDDTIEAPAGDDPGAAQDPARDDTIAAPAAAPAPPDPDAQRQMLESRDRDQPVLGPVDPGRYLPGYELARGGMGRILAARDRRLGRVIAIKELVAGSRPADFDREARFQREALITSRLQHPAIVSLHDAGRWPSGQPFYTMKLVAGRSLAQVAGEARPVDERLALLPNLIAMVEAVAHAHRQHIIHRDLKPSNVLIGDLGETVVLDWGLAKDLAARPGDQTYLPPAEPPPDPREKGDQQVQPEVDRADPPAGPHDSSGPLTMAGSVMGTPGYMPPEQAAGEEVDPRADVYALGAILYHLLGGSPPYTGPNAAAILAAVIAGPPARLLQLAPGLPQDLVTIVEKAMAREPGARYATAVELAQDLRRFQTGQLVAAHRYSRRQLIWRFLVRHRGAAVVSLVAVVAIAAVGVFGLRRVWSERDRAEAASAEARLHLARTYLEQGRQLLLDEDAARALPFLVAARELGIESSILRMLFAQARRRLWLVSLETPVPPVTDRPGLRSTATLPGAVLSPDGSRVAAASDERSARVWDAATGVPITPPLRHADRVTKVLFSPDGGRVVTASQDRTVHIWDAATGSARLPPIAHDRGVGGAMFDRDGALLLTASDNVVRIWDPATGHAVSPPLNHEGRVERAGFVPPPSHRPTGADSRTLVLTSTRETARLWDARTGELVFPLPENYRPGVLHPEPIYKTVRLSEDGSTFLLGDRDGNALIRRRDDERARSLRGHLANAGIVELDRDGSRLLTRGQDDDGVGGQPTRPTSSSSDVRIWNTEEGELACSPLQHADLVHTAGFSRNGTRVVTTSRDRTARVWDASTCQPLSAPLRHEAGVVHADLTDDATRIVTTGDDGRVRIWDASTGGPLPVVGPLVEADASVTFSRDLRRAFIVGPGGRGRIWDAATGKVLATRLRRGDELMPGFSEDGTRVLVADGPIAGSARVWNGVTGKLSSPFGHGRWFRAEFSPDGTRVVTASHDRTARIWSADTGRPLTPPLRHEHAVLTAVFRPDGRQVLTASGAVARFWDATTGAPIGVPLRHLQAINLAAFSRDGARVVTASDDGTARIWDAASGKPVAPPLQHGQPVDQASFSPDGELVLTGDRSRLRVWLAARGEPLVSLADSANVVSPEFSPGGRLVVAAGGKAGQLGSSMAIVWDARTGNVLARFPHHLIQWAAFTPAGDRLVTFSRRNTLVWDMAVDGGTLAQWKALLARCVPFVLEQGALVRREIATGACRRAPTDHR